MPPVLSRIIKVDLVTPADSCATVTKVLWKKGSTVFLIPDLQLGQHADMMPNVENVHSPRNRSVSLTAEITSTTVEALEDSLFAGPWADLDSGINIGVF